MYTEWAQMSLPFSAVPEEWQNPYSGLYSVLAWLLDLDQEQDPAWLPPLTVCYDIDSPALSVCLISPDNRLFELGGEKSLKICKPYAQK